MIIFMPLDKLQQFILLEIVMPI